MEDQDISVYVPRSNIVVAILMGLLCIFLALVLGFLGERQFFTLLVSFFLVIAGFWFGVFLAWKLVRYPALVINSEGIIRQHPFVHAQIYWNEIDAIYPVNFGAAFAIDLSPAGLLTYFSRQGGRIPRRLDVTVPQLVLLIQGINVALPIEHLLNLICERFAIQLEHYNIYVVPISGESREPKS